MVAYWVARSKVNDPERYKKYADLAPAIIGKFGGKFLARGGKFKILEGPEKGASSARSPAATRPSTRQPRRIAKRTAPGSSRSRSSRACRRSSVGGSVRWSSPPDHR